MKPVLIRDEQVLLLSSRRTSTSSEAWNDFVGAKRELPMAAGGNARIVNQSPRETIRAIGAQTVKKARKPHPRTNWRHARLVTYDVIDDRRRARIAEFLKRRGIRLQKSVFLVSVDRHALPEFVRALDTMRDARDFVDVMPLCKGCRDRSIRLGPLMPVAIVVIG